MQGAALLCLTLLGGLTEYARSLDSRALDQAAFDAETYGEKKDLKREADGLHLKLAPGDPETGWKTPQNVRFGGNFTITADFVVTTLPKPGQEDGAAVGVAIAYQDINHPDLTLIRLREPSGADVYRAIDKASANPGQPPMMMVNNGMGMVMVGGPMNPMGPGNKPPKPPRHTFPAAGTTFRLELKREGQVIRYQALDAKTGQPRYLGQLLSQGPMDVAAIKLFATNRNGAEPIDVVLKSLTVHADRVTGLGTVIRTIRGHLVYGDPTGIEDGKLLVGAPGNQPPGAPPPGAMPPGAVPPGATPTTVRRAGAAVPAPAPAVAVAVAPQGAVVVAQAIAPAAPVAAPAPAPSAPQATPATGQNPGAPAPANAPNPNQPKPAKTEPKARVPLDEIESILFERNPTPGGRFLGQPNVDVTMRHPDAKKDEPPAASKEAKPAEKSKDQPKPAETPKAETEKKDVKADEKARVAEAAARAEVAKAEVAKAEVAKTEARPAAKAEVARTAENAADASKKDEKAKDKDKKDPKKPNPGDDILAPPPGTAEAPKAAPKVEAKPNGIRDVHLWLFGLREAPINQVTVNCQTDGGPTSWRLDTSGSQDWPLVLKRAGNGPTADLFLEPPGKDCHQKDFAVTINYGDGQMANFQVKATGHSDARLAVDPKAPATPRPDARVFLAGGEQVFGKLDAIGDENLTMMIPWKDSFQVPLSRIVGFQLSTPDSKESAASFAKRLKERGAEDLLLARTKDGEVVAIAGVVEGTQGDRLKFRFNDKSRTLPVALVEGLVMASRPDPPAPTSPQPSFSLPGNVVLSGSWKEVEGATWKVETPWGAKLDLPSGEVQGVRFRGGKLTFLSDLKPSKVEEAPFFGRKLPWRADANLLGGPLKVGGKAFDRGLAVHSRCVLTYDLNGRYDSFQALVGFDDDAGGKGRADVRVLADGKEVFANPDLRADKDAVTLELPVAGAQQLTLIVDFGRGEDTGDRVIWADARLYRRDPGATSEKAADRR